MIAEKINNQDYVDVNGDVRYIDDLGPDEEIITIAKDPAFVVATRGMVRNVQGRRRSRGELGPSGRDIARFIDDAIAEATVVKGVDLTDEEIEKISRAVENTLRR